MAETIPYLYTSRDEIISVLSEVGVDLRLDDDGDGTVDAGEEEFLDDLIEEATDEINIHVHTWYDAEQLANSKWVRRRCSWIAAHLACQRRGNPAQFGTRIDKIYSDLEKVQSGEFYIPRVPYRNDQGPAVSNLIVDDRHPVRKIRVQTMTSTGGFTGLDHIDNPFLGDEY